MILVGDADIATSVLVIPCDKQRCYYINVKHLPAEKQPILYGDYKSQYIYARKCICGTTPCKGILDPDWNKTMYTSYLPIGETYEIQKEKVKVAKDLLKKTHGKVNDLIEILQEYYHEFLD